MGERKGGGREEGRMGEGRMGEEGGMGGRKGGGWERVSERGRKDLLGPTDKTTEISFLPVP